MKQVKTRNKQTNKQNVIYTTDTEFYNATQYNIHTIQGQYYIPFTDVLSDVTVDDVTPSIT